MIYCARKSCFCDFCLLFESLTHFAMPSQAQAPAFESITDKILQLLVKTKDALILDLEKEFSSVREAIEKAQAQSGGKGTPSGFDTPDVCLERLKTFYKGAI